MTIHTVGVVGAGTMGNGIAQVFAQAGYTVKLVDTVAPALERARTTISRSVAKLVEKGKLSAAEGDATLGRIVTDTELDGLVEADYVVEAIIESLDAKRAIFGQLDAVTRPEVILASNTSSISVTALGAVTTRPDRVLGMHFMNPVPLMTLVELIRGQATSPDAMQVASDLCVKLGKTAVEAADYPGFIANRLLLPMINEAIYTVMEGVGSPEAVDTVMRLGLHHPMGPLQLADFIGLDVCLAFSMCSTMGLAIQSIARARSCGGWWSPVTWAGSPAEVFTPTHRIFSYTCIDSSFIDTTGRRPVKCACFRPKRISLHRESSPSK